MLYLGIFGLKFLKTIVLFEISTLKFVTNESLTHTVNFDIGYAFSKGPGSAFSEGPGPGPGPLYKVCPYLVLCFFRYMPAYSIIFSVIKAYSRILRHYQGIFRLIQAYSALCVTIAYSQPSHILSPGICRTGG